MSTETDEFAVCWEDGDHNRLAFERLKHLPFDLRSWANFAALQMGRASFAAMTLHMKGGEKRRAKLIPADRLRYGMHFENIT